MMRSLFFWGLASAGVNAISGVQVFGSDFEPSTFTLADSTRTNNLLNDNSRVSIAAVNPTTFVAAFEEDSEIKFILSTLQGPATSFPRQGRSIQVNRFSSTVGSYSRPHVAAFSLATDSDSSADSFVITYECRDLLGVPRRFIGREGQPIRRDICVSRFDILGNRIGEESIVNDDGESLVHTRPAVTTFEDGSFVVAWWVDDEDIALQVYNDKGTRVGANQIVLRDQDLAVGNAEGLAIATLTDQTFVLGFVRSRGSDVVLDDELRVQRFLKSGVRLGNQIRVTDSLALQDLEVDRFSLTALPTGGFAAAYTADNIGAIEIIKVRAFNPDSNGRLVGSQDIIANNDVATDGADFPSIVPVGSDGGFIVSWSEVAFPLPGQDLFIDGQRSLFVRQFDRESRAVGPSREIRFSGPTGEGPRQTIMQRFPQTERFVIMAATQSGVQGFVTKANTESPTQAPTQAPTPFPTPSTAARRCSRFNRRQCQSANMCRFVARNNVGCIPK